MSSKSKVEVAIAVIVLVLVVWAGVALVSNVMSSKNKKPPVINEPVSNNYTGEVPPVTNTNMNQPEAPSTLQVQDIKVGTGKAVKSGDTVVINYSGTLLDGTKFDSSYDRGTPFETKIGVGAVIKGWDQGVVGMKVGGKRKLVIPPELGYGSEARGKIPANATLVFELELMGIK